MHRFDYRLFRYSKLSSSRLLDYLDTCLPRCHPLHFNPRQMLLCPHSLLSSNPRLRPLLCTTTRVVIRFKRCESFCWDSQGQLQQSFSGQCQCLPSVKSEKHSTKSEISTSSSQLREEKLKMDKTATGIKREYLQKRKHKKGGLAYVPK